MSREELEASKRELEARNQELEAQVAILTQQVGYLKRQLFGQKSEKGFDHPELFGGEPGKEGPSGGADAPAGGDTSGGEGKASDAPKGEKKRPIRKERLPENLPVVTEEVIPEAVREDPSAWRAAGCEESFQLEKEPAYYYLRRTVRLKFVPAEDPLKAPVIAPAKPAIIDGGFWGPGLLAGVLADKYLYHLPWSRQHVREKQRFGVDLSPQTMSDAADKVAGQCAILVARMKERMLAGGYLCADETFVRYLDPLEAKGSSTGCFWAYRGGGKDVIFDWQTSREHCHVGDWIGPDFEGVLLSDGYEAYSNYCKEQGRRGKNVRRAACLAHIRRKFEAAKDQRPELVAWVLRIIAQLYRIETPLREYQAGEEVRARVRERNSRPLIRLLGKAFKHLLTTSRILPKSSLGKALRYALAQWPHMGTYLEDGRAAIDNNDLEPERSGDSQPQAARRASKARQNDIRPSAVGKRNWLFVGSPEAGRRGAVLYSLIISARNHGADPQAYLRDVIERLPGTRLDDLDQLLPGAWAEAHRDAHPAILAPRSA